MTSWLGWLEHPGFLGLLGLLPFVVVAVRWAGRRRRRDAQAFGGGLALNRSSLGTPRGSRWLGAFALTLLIVGTVGPRWGMDRERPRGPRRDLIVVLDVSRSMLAEDRAVSGRLQSRLARAKHHLRELADELQRSGGYRIGLVVFAGQARGYSPLTQDYDHFRQMLAQAHPDHLGPAGRLGPKDEGTRIRDALELAVAYHEPEQRGFQDILLVSDGEDLGGDALEGAARARAAGIVVDVLAIGDPDRPSLIPDGAGHLRRRTDDGREEYVSTRRRDDTMQAIARQSRGSFLAEEVETSPLGRWFQTEFSGRPTWEGSGSDAPAQAAQFAWFFAGALIVLLAEMAVADAPTRSQRI